MNQTEEFRDDLETELLYLTDACLNDTISDEQLTRLDALVSHNAEAQRLYFQSLQQGLWLRSWATNAIDSGPSMADPAPLAVSSTEARATSPVLGFLGRTTAAMNRPVFWSICGVGLLFCCYAGVLLWNLRHGRALNGINSNDIAVAVLGDSQSVQWAKEMTPKVLGTSVRSGESLKIDSGLVELQLKQGATLVIEGPADWQINGENSATLTHGKLVARVPQQAIGFTLETPTATIIDLGTEFGVEVNSSGTADVHVVKGEIEVKRVGNSSKPGPGTLRAGQSAQVTAEGSNVEDSPAVPEKFKRLIAASESKTSDVTASQTTYPEAVTKAAPLIYWQFDALGENDTVPNAAGDRHPARLLGGAKIVTPENLGQSAYVRFDAPAACVTCDELISGLMSGDCTIEFWARFSTPPNGNFVALNEERDSRCAMLMAAELNKGSRFLHRVPPGITGGSSIYSSADLALDTWHHFVGLKFKSTILLYVDGKHAGQATAAQGDTADLRVTLGRLHHTAAANARPFAGELDEFAIYPRALSEREIKEHYTLGKPVFAEVSK